MVFISLLMLLSMAVNCWDHEWLSKPELVQVLELINHVTTNNPDDPTTENLSSNKN